MIAFKTANRWIDQVDELDNGKPELPKRYRNRKPAGELAAAADVAKGFVCPRCQCNDTRVVNSREVPTGRRRSRVCRACGYEVQTHEVMTTDVDLDAMMQRLIGILRG